MLATVWFYIWGLLWAIYFVLDGFDLGLGILLPLVSREDKERRVVLNSMGPFWDGNEVWLITAGGVTFAAFPGAYATMFSALYTPLMLLLFGLILRGVSLEFRGKVDHPVWRRTWDWCLFLGSFLPALLFGVAFANIFKGLPFDAGGISHGTLLALLNPYGLAGGLLFLALFAVHGALWLAIKAEGPLHERAASLAGALWQPLVVLAAIFLVSSAFETRLYDNYLRHRALFIVPLLALLGLAGSRLFMAQRAWWKAWFASGLTIASATIFGVVGLYPNLLPSSAAPTASRTIYNCASSPLTLKIMLGVALVAVPLVIAYQTWVYFLFRDKVQEKDLHY